MLLCKTCIENKITEWKKPFDPNAPKFERIPDYYETMQHVWDFDVPTLAAKLFNGEMLEVFCVSCKLTHIGKDANGVIKVKYGKDPDEDWQDYVI